MFGHNLKKWREVKNVSQRELAKMICGSQTTIVNIENGKQSPSEDIMRKIASALNVPLALLIDNNIGKHVALEELYKDNPEVLRFISSLDSKPYIMLAKEANEANITKDELNMLLKIIKKNR